MIEAGRMVGEQIGNYRVIGPAVPWPVADVYVGQDARTGQIVDITLLPPDTAASAGGADQFLGEMRAILGFRHPGFVQLLDCDRLNDGAVYLVSEHVESECLSERLKRGGGLVSDLATVREIVGQTAEALEAAHKAGLLYLCLRPEHMLLVPASQPGLQVTVRLLQLGLGSYFLARIRQMAPGKELPAAMLRYCSLEQRSGSSVSRRSDIYALGGVLYELLVGRPPFLDTDLWGLVYKAPRRIRELRPELPSALDDLVAKMLEKEPAQRPSSMEEIIAVMRAVPEPGSIAEFADAPPSAPFARTVILDPGPPVPKPADDISSTPGFRPTRLLSPDAEAVAPERPAVVARPRRVARDPSPASAGTAPARRRPTPAKDGRTTVNAQKSSRTGILVGVTLACIALGVGLLLWFVHPKVSEARRTPIEETPAREHPPFPPATPSLAPAAAEMPAAVIPQSAAALTLPKPGPIDKPSLNLGKVRAFDGRTKVRTPASPRPVQPHGDMLPPTFMKH
jgi:serine/threonine protein kinase